VTSTKWDLIYELRADKERVLRVLDKNANFEGNGLSTGSYVFGSDQWWAAIDSGAIDRRSVEGTITESKSTSLPDRQEFRMLTTGNAELTGARWGDPTRYVEGLRIRLEYATLQRTPASPSDPTTTSDVVIAVWIEHSHKRTPYAHSVYPPFPGPLIFGI